MSGDAGDDFDLGSMYTPTINTSSISAPSPDVVNPDEDESWYNQSKLAAAQAAQGAGSDGRTILNGNNLLSIANNVSPLQQTNPGGMFSGVSQYSSNGDSGDGNVPSVQYYNPGSYSGGLQDIGYGGTYTSQQDYNNQVSGLEQSMGLAPGGQYAFGKYENPTGNGDKDQAIIYYDQSGKPVYANNQYQASNWVNGGREFAKAAAIIGGSAIGAGYLGAGEAGAGAAEGAGGDALADVGFSGAGDLGAEEGVGGLATDGGFGSEGLSGMDLAADAPLGTGNNVITAGSALNGGGSLLGSMGKGALINGGKTAVTGGNLGDIVKSGAYGAAGGAVGYGVGQYNPGGLVTDNTDYQSIINRGVSGGANAAISGGNPLEGAAYSGALQGGNVLGSSLYNNFLGSPTGGGDAGGDAMPDVGTLGGTMQDEYGENSATLGGDTTPAQYNANLNSGLSDSSGVSTPQTQQPDQQANPLKDQLMKALGLGGTGIAGAGGKGAGAGDMAGSLLGMYSAFQNRRKLGGLADNLSSLYSPNSPYAQQLSQQLARRDAAAGRNSQYGSRAVELQARLADLNSRNAPTLQSLYAAQGGQTNALLNNALRFGGQSGISGAVSNASAPWLNSLFNSPMGQPNVGPQEF